MRTGLRAKSEKIVMTTSGKKQDRRNLGQARVPSYNILHMEILLRKIKSKLFLPQRKKVQCFFFDIFAKLLSTIFQNRIFFFQYRSNIIYDQTVSLYLYLYNALKLEK